MKTFPHYLQLDAMDCGPTCLRMIARYYGKNYSLQTLRERSFITREGVSMLGISFAAESIGFRTSGKCVLPPEATGGRRAASVHPALEPETTSWCAMTSGRKRNGYRLYSRPPRRTSYTPNRR